MGAAAQGKILRRNAIILVVIAVLVVIAGYAGASVLALSAQGQLDAATDRTQDRVQRLQHCTEEWPRNVTTTFDSG